MKLKDLETGRYLLELEEDGISGITLLVEVYREMGKFVLIESYVSTIRNDYWDFLMDIDEDKMDYKILEKQRL